MRARITLGLLAAAALATAGCESIRPKASPPDPPQSAEDDCLNGKPDRIHLVWPSTDPGLATGSSRSDGGPGGVSGDRPGVASGLEARRGDEAALPVDPELESLLGQSGEPRLAAVNRSVYLTLRTLDAELRREQKLAGCRNPLALQAQTQTAAGAAGGADTVAGASGTAPVASGAGGGSGTTGSSAGDASSRAAGAATVYAARKASPQPAGGGGNGAIAPKTSPGNDNDIVARRLRKAAEQETDPVLRAKLWQEYWNYRQGTAAK